MKPRKSDLQWPASLAFFLTLFGACGGTETEFLDAQSVLTQEIRHGVETQSRPEVGKVYSFFGISLCTGTLIAPDLVLTAAHCVSGTTSNDVQFQPGTRGAGLYQVRDLRLTPGFVNVAVPGKPDLALLKLREPVPGVPAATLASQPVSIGSIVDVFGYGRDESNGNAGIKRQGKMRVTAYESGTARLPDGTSYTARDIVFAPAGNDELTCSGDSGGPVFNAQGQILGVNSYVTYPDESRQACADFTGAGAVSVPDNLALLHAWRQELLAANPDSGANTPGPAPTPTLPPGACQKTNARFQNATTGCQDKATGRIWSKRKRARKQQSAKAVCLDLREAGVSDWRLPTKRELLKLAANRGAKSLKGVGNHFYWSKSKRSGKGIVVKVRKQKMKTLSPNQKKPFYCVRN